ncbi:MAG: calcium-binding protein, partial [Tepidisphaeraceae bacterium]
PLGEEIELGESLPGEGLDKHVYGADVDVMADGGFVASFGQDVEGANTAYARRYDAAGASVGGPVVVGAHFQPGANDSGDVYSPHIGAGAGGTVVVTRLADRNDLVRVRRLSSDSVTLERGALSILGSAGDDTITVSLSGSNIVVTNGSTDRTFAAADVQFISINSFGGDDRVTNDTSLPSTLSGGEGDDTIFGGGGSDRIRGEAGRDSLWGRDGNDRLFGDEGVDSLYGNGGRDRIDGGPNSDHIRGNGGRDKLFGGHGHDRLYGGAAGDWIYGQASNDQILGEGGNDRLYGDDGGADTLRGGAGDDVFITLDGVIDELFGDGGDDSAIADEDDVLISIKPLL